MRPNIKQEFINLILMENSCKQKLRTEFSVKLDIRYTDYFPEYAKYFGRALRLLKSMYGMTNYGKFFADELT